MLKDIRELGKSLKLNFTAITDWNEISFNDEDKSRLSEIDMVSTVGTHSITFKIDDNHCIIPSQYILYAVFFKEFALALRGHVDVFDQFKKNKSRNEIGSFITTKNYNLDDLNLDAWSKSIALKPVTDSEYNFGAKSIINGNKGNYKVRGTSDFFTSVILKIINIPDASSSMLGKLVYSLSGNVELYDYLEKRFFNKIPFIVKEKKTNKFAYKVLSYLYQFDRLNKIENLIVKNTEESFRSIKFNSENISLTSIFKASKSLLDDSQLTQAGKIRFFNTPLYVNKDDEFCYFSTEWTFGTNSRLDLENLIVLLKIFYPEFTIYSENDIYIFKAVDAPKNKHIIPQVDFIIKDFFNSSTNNGLFFSNPLISRFAASLITKPFVILTGLSGSGKTKLAQAFVSMTANTVLFLSVQTGQTGTHF
jgi:hypothetical protein